MMSHIIDTIHCDNPYRKDQCYIFLDIMASYAEIVGIPVINILSISIDIEGGCYNNTIEVAIQKDIRTDFNIKFIRLYKSICLRVSRNLDPSSDVESYYLLESISMGNISPKNIGYMDKNQLNPHRNNNIISQIDRQRNEKINVKVSNLYKCSKCRNNSTTVQDVQLRAVDEGSNTRIT